MTERIALTTGVTCPTLRMHPAINAHAAATAAVMLPGRFAFGVGSGEALNEHVLGTHWPEAVVRLEMLEEAIEVIRLLWQGGQHSHRGRHYTVENARLYTLPNEPPPIVVSGFGPKSAAVAARIGDGYLITFPSEELIATFRQAGGEGKPIQAGMKVCYGEDQAAARATAHELWRNESLPGELAHFEQASQLLTEDMVAANVPCGRTSKRTSRSSSSSPRSVSMSCTSSRSAPTRRRSSRYTNARSCRDSRASGQLERPPTNGRAAQRLHAAGAAALGQI